MSPSTAGDAREPIAEETEVAVLFDDFDDFACFDGDADGFSFFSVASGASSSSSLVFAGFAGFACFTFFLRVFTTRGTPVGGDVPESREERSHSMGHEWMSHGSGRHRRKRRQETL